MATKLRKLRITRVDRVWAPANGDAEGPLARIVLAKAREPKADPNHDHSDLAPGERCKGCAWTKPMAKSATDPGGGMPTETEQLEQLRKDMDAAVAAGVAEATAPLQAQVDQFTAEKTEFEAAVAATTDPDEIDKSALPEPVRKRLEEAEAVAKAAEDAVAKMRDDAEAARWLDVAKGLPFVAISKDVGGDAAAETGALLHSIAKAAGAEPAAQLLGVLEAAQSKLAQSELLKAAGKDGRGPVGGAEERLQKAASDIRKAAPELSDAQAYAQAVAGNPALALEAQKEMASA